VRKQIFGADALASEPPAPAAAIDAPAPAASALPSNPTRQHVNRRLRRAPVQYFARTRGFHVGAAVGTTSRRSAVAPVLLHACSTRQARRPSARGSGVPRFSLRHSGQASGSDLASRTHPAWLHPSRTITPTARPDRFVATKTQLAALPLSVDLPAFGGSICVSEPGSIPVSVKVSSFRTQSSISW